MYEDIPQLEVDLNTAVNVLGLHCNFNTFGERMTFLSENGTIYNYVSCQCCQEGQTYDAFDPPEGSLCSWSCLFSLLTGLVDPRHSFNTFPRDSLMCHSPYGPNMQQAEYDIFKAFTDVTKVLVIA